MVCQTGIGGLGYTKGENMDEPLETDDTRCLLVACIMFFSGLMLGMATGVLLAPQSGTRTRRHLRSMVEDASERANEWVGDAREAVNEVMDRGKKIVKKPSR